MMIPAYTRIPITGSSSIGTFRRAASTMAASAGLSASGVGKVEIVATELGTNLVKHAQRGGELLLREISGDAGEHGVEILSIDKGPGMMSTADMMVDGTTTGSSMGTGLGAIRRLSSTFEIDSRLDKGTVVLSRVCKKSPPQMNEDIEFGGVRIPISGETSCGDNFAVAHDETEPGKLRFMLADGLGHGVKAAMASNRAVEVFIENPDLVPTELIKLMHGELKNTHGAAVACGTLDTTRGELAYCGVGNISGRILLASGGGRGCVSVGGIVGYQSIRIKEFAYEFGAEDIGLVIASDGLQSAAMGTDVMHCSPTLMSAIMYRDYSRGNDDVSVLVIKRRSKQ